MLITESQIRQIIRTKLVKNILKEEDVTQENKKKYDAAKKVIIDKLNSIFTNLNHYVEKPNDFQKINNHNDLYTFFEKIGIDKFKYDEPNQLTTKFEPREYNYCYNTTVTSATADIYESKDGSNYYYRNATLANSEIKDKLNKFIKGFNPGSNKDSIFINDSDFVDLLEDYFAADKTIYIHLDINKINKFLNNNQNQEKNQEKNQEDQGNKNPEKSNTTETTTVDVNQDASVEDLSGVLSAFVVPNLPKGYYQLAKILVSENELNALKKNKKGFIKASGEQIAKIAELFQGILGNKPAQTLINSFSKNGKPLMLKAGETIDFGNLKINSTLLPGNLAQQLGDKRITLKQMFDLRAQKAKKQQTSPADNNDEKLKKILKSLGISDTNPDNILASLKKKKIDLSGAKNQEELFKRLNQQKPQILKIAQGQLKDEDLDFEDEDEDTDQGE